MVVEKSLTKNLSKKGGGGGWKGRKEERTNVNLYAPYFSKRGYKNHDHGGVSIYIQVRTLQKKVYLGKTSQ